MNTLKYIAGIITAIVVSTNICYGEKLLQQPFYFGVLQSKDENLARNRQSGANIVVVGLGWDRAEPNQGEFSSEYFKEISEKIKIRRKLGYSIALDLGFQYPPDWIFDLPHSYYINQYGQKFFSTNIGENIPNAVFNQAIRDCQESYLKEVFKHFKDFELIRLGWTKYGELAYPIHKYGGEKNCYWAFDDIAQGKSKGLAEGLSSCPLPGWIPGNQSVDNKDAAKFLQWYIGALQNYHDWQIKTVRRFTSKPLAMLYPSWGMRPGSIQKAIKGDLNGSTSSEINGEVQRGLDFKRLISGISDTNVYVYCTWIDSNPHFSNDAGSNPAYWSPAHYLAFLAQEHQPPLQIWGENTGGGDMKTVELCFERIKKYNYNGFLWAFEHQLYDGKKPEIEDFKPYLKRLN